MFITGENSQKLMYIFVRKIKIYMPIFTYSQINFVESGRAGLRV